MLRPLSEWNDAYLDEIDRMDETLFLEKRQSENLTEAEIAKQVCTMANSGGGYVVFGMKDRKAGGGFDSGVETTKGRQDVTSWVEALIPKLHEPPITGCEARQIRRQAHALDQCVLVLSIPSSDRRPHWVKSHREEVYFFNAL